MPDETPHETPHEIPHETPLQFRPSKNWDLVAAWPSDNVPVEIFELITSYLSRYEVRSLRLVNKEFEAKVSAQYFRNVVVPFKSELYNNLNHDDEDAIKRSSSALFSNGMRIFQSFGRHILRFALSLELDEEALSYPPIKPSQEAVPAFWGIYRWPHGTYHRYTDLEGLEQTADETDAMKEALKCLVKVTNIGLCCDAGLGFLSGPDHIARSATIRHPVFATQNWRRAGYEMEQRQHSIVAMSDFSDMVKDTKRPVFENPMSFKRTILHKMAADAGFRGADINAAMQMILESEGTSLMAIDFDERASQLPDFEARRPLAPAHVYPDFEPDGADEHPLVPTSLSRAQKEMLLELEWAHRAMIQSYVIGLSDNAIEGCFTNLTTLTIAKIPSSHVYIFYREELWQNLSALNNVSLGVIADWRRVSKPAPGCVVDISVSPVEAVGKVFQLLNNYIGAQKNIESLHFEWICGGEFAPGTFQRNHYILPAPFFEQAELMGATDSPKTHSEQILSLPFIKHLSLKNCWSSPHVLLQTFRNMALSSLEKLELESVSLSGPPTSAAQAPLQQHAAAHQALHGGNLMNFLQLGAAQQQPMLAAAVPLPANLPVPHGPQGPLPQPTVFLQPNQGPLMIPQYPTAAPVGHGLPTNQAQATNQGGAAGNANPNPTPQEVLQHPERLSWGGIVEHFSPGIKIRDLLAREEIYVSEAELLWIEQENPLAEHLPRAAALARDEKNYTLKCLSFKSCGYVSVDSAFINTRGILPHGAQGLTANGNPYGQDISPLMQRCRDKMLARIAPYIRSSEVFQLVHAFGMDIGWDNVYDDKTIDDAVADGVDIPGRGRFSGTIDAKSSEGREIPIIPSPMPILPPGFEGIAPYV
ncbi:hypothetical protein B0J13DRAFT_445592 [Dactylonectria estremocensis]|uniref:F-box domain-containing protein n=1 Tax=Dactylonectria estremocensis TaxID=1079267 RepID=A0A9P9EKK2_9HYPO|nr:hypothetical protein B0J13DRAFT_445592 [Dactylonectria estremocensis]